MNDVYAPCLCGSGKKFKFCCYGLLKKADETFLTLECSRFPIHECKVLGDWEMTGISPVHVSRKLTDTSYFFVSYLVDFWCLGLKDTIVKCGISRTDLKCTYGKSDDFETISYQDARSMVLGAIDFAQSIHISPDPSWHGIPSLFIESHMAYEKTFSFGRQGKPYYVSGPYDHERYDTEEILDKISKADGTYNAYIEL